MGGRRLEAEPPLPLRGHGDDQQHPLEPLARGQAAPLPRPPRDLLPSRLAGSTAHLGTAIEFTLPPLLLVTSGGTLGTIAVAGMVIFHLHILSTFPLAVPLEWNIFMIFGLLFLFGHYGDVRSRPSTTRC